MSAYICPAKQIGVIAQQLVEFERKGIPSVVAQELATLNVQAVAYRYGQLGEIDKCVEDFLGVDLEAYLTQCRVEAGKKQEPLSHAKLWSTLGNYTYQCSEGDYDEQPLYKRVESFEEAEKAYCQVNQLERDGWGW
jgi:hypothetical protein